MKKRMFYLLVFMLSTGSLYAEDSPQEALSNSTKQMDQQFEGFNLQGYDKTTGEKSWDVKGDKADILGEETKLHNVEANAYGDNKMNITAKTGTYNTTSGNMKLEKDVVITSEQGQQLMTDTLNWDKDKDLVSTDDKVLITDERMTATGQGLKGKPGLKEAQINKDVTVRIDTEDEESQNKLVTVTCDGPMEIEQSKSMAIFNKNVVAVQEDQTLKADKMEIYFNQDMNNLTKVICIGNVEIIRGENKTYADRAEYDAITRKITLTGRPKLILKTEGEDGVSSFGN